MNEASVGKANLSGVVLAMLLFIACPASAQLKTIPQQLLEQGTDLMSGASVPSGATPELEFVLEDVDVIVRGIVGTPKSYLSKNQLTIFSDYPIIKPVVYFDTVVASSSKPGFPEIVVTLQGGKISIGGLTFTVAPGALPGLEPGSDCFLLLQRIKGKLFVAGGGHLGAFEIRAGRLMSLSRVHDFAPAYSGSMAPGAIDAIVLRRLSLQR